MKKFGKSIFAALSSNSDSALVSDQLLMEEGSARSFSPSASVTSESPLTTDSVTVSVVESADCVAEAVANSLDQQPSPALDQFLGQHYTRLARWTGTTLQHFKPKNLTFFKLVVLAHVVHRQYPHYTCLRKNCIFYASLIYDAAE
jgi:hypothetical protein